MSLRTRGPVEMRAKRLDSNAHQLGRLMTIAQIKLACGPPEAQLLGVTSRRAASLWPGLDVTSMVSSG
jgi:hypothetical protein